MSDVGLESQVAVCLLTWVLGYGLNLHPSQEQQVLPLVSFLNTK